jgi:hypothetical protein
MNAIAEIVKVVIADLLRDRVRRLGLNELKGEAKKVVELALGLSEQLLGDVGTICASFLQVVDLAPGEATFLSVGGLALWRCALPQSQSTLFCISYSHFFCVLTTPTGRYYRSHGDVGQRPPEHRDVDNLPASRTWTFGVQHSMDPKPLLSSMMAEYSWVYDPPVPEFSVVQIHRSSLSQRAREGSAHLRKTTHA